MEDDVDDLDERARAAGLRIVHARPKRTSYTLFPIVMIVATWAFYTALVVIAAKYGLLH